MQEYFWAICLEENSIQAAIWKIENGAASVIDVSNPASWEDDEVLITATDGCLSSCIAKLPEDAPEPNKTIFGVSASWVTDGQIQKQYLEKIKLICNKLSLTPTGFVTLPESISHFEKSREKLPISAVLIGIYSQNIEVSVFRLGNLTGSVAVARSTSIYEDLIEGFARFGVQEPYPSRFLLYDSKSRTLEDAKQELIKADWDGNESVKFLHTPQVEILAPEDKMAALCLAGASEIAQISNINLNNSDENTEQVTENINEESNIEGVVDAATLGFTSSFDSPEANQTLTQQPTIRNIQQKIKIPKLGNIKLPRFRVKENMLFVVAILVLVLIIGGLAAWWFLPKAQVTIIVAPKKIDAHEKIVYDPKAGSVDVGKKIVPAKSQSVSPEGEKTKTTTGTKTIGTASKGTVTFYNVADEVIIPAGTTLSTATLQFSLDDEVKIASASGAASASSAKGSITSKGVGADYNLASNTFFSVGNFSTSTIQAKNESDLSGGSSQEVAAVGEEDEESLTKDLLKELTDRGKDDLKQSLTSGSLLVENTVSAKTDSKSLDHEVGEEATTVKLSMALKVSGLTVVRDDMYNLARELYKTQVPDGFSMKDDQIDFIFGTKDTNFVINLLPTIDTDKLAKEIAGKNKSEAKKILSKVAGYSDAEIEITPNLFGLQILPHIDDNISVTLSGK